MPKEGVQVVKLQTTDRPWDGGRSLMSHGVISPPRYIKCFLGLFHKWSTF